MDAEGYGAAGVRGTVWQQEKLCLSMEKKKRIHAILVSIPRGAMEWHRKQLARSLVLAALLIAAAAICLLPSLLQAQA